VFIAENFYRALATRPYGVERGMVAEVRQVKAHRKAGVEQILSVFYHMRLIVNVDGCHNSP
jgi:hypothetical protein